MHPEHRAMVEVPGQSRNEQKKMNAWGSQLSTTSFPPCQARARATQEGGGRRTSNALQSDRRTSDVHVHATGLGPGRTSEKGYKHP